MQHPPIGYERTNPCPASATHEAPGRVRLLAVLPAVTMHVVRGRGGRAARRGHCGDREVFCLRHLRECLVLLIAEPDVEQPGRGIRAGDGCPGGIGVVGVGVLLNPFADRQPGRVGPVGQFAADAFQSRS